MLLFESLQAALMLVTVLTLKCEMAVNVIFISDHVSV